MHDFQISLEKVTFRNVEYKKKVLGYISVNNNDDGTLNIKGFDYDDLVEESLKNVVKKVLKITAESGLVGNSHFFISFNGNDNEVIVPDELKSSDSSEIKIIIQHQFWDLKATDEHFEVTLSFNGQKKNIYVPYKAITSFTDPSVGFGLQFKVEEKEIISNEEKKDENIVLENKKDQTKLTNETGSGEIISLNEFRDKK